MGVDRHHSKSVFVRIHRPIIAKGQIGGPAPGRGKSPKVPHPLILKTQFLEIGNEIRKNGSCRHVRIAEVSENVDLVEIAIQM